MLYRERKVARALIVSPDSSILLMKMVLSDRSFWITPGGGIEDHEDTSTALRRELNEEIGLDSWNIGPEVWMRSHTFSFEGEFLTQHEKFHWVSSKWFRPPDEMPDIRESRYFGGFKWWAVDELLASTDQFAPRNLPTCFRDLLSGGMPESPINVGV